MRSMLQRDPGTTSGKACNLNRVNRPEAAASCIILKTSHFECNFEPELRFDA
jgi:hypothetical protein